MSTSQSPLTKSYLNRDFSFFPSKKLQIFHIKDQMNTQAYQLSHEVMSMAWIMLRIDYSRLFWRLFGMFSYENHEGKHRII